MIWGTMQAAGWQEFFFGHLLTSSKKRCVVPCATSPALIAAVFEQKVEATLAGVQAGKDANMLDSIGRNQLAEGDA